MWQVDGDVIYWTLGKESVGGDKKSDWFIYTTLSALYRQEFPGKVLRIPEFPVVILDLVCLVG